MSISSDFLYYKLVKFALEIYLALYGVDVIMTSSKMNEFVEVII